MLTNDKIRLSDIKRQIEIAFMIKEKANYYTKYDLAVIFPVDVSRIHRDIGELRKMGVDIHSRKGRYFIYAQNFIPGPLIKFYIAILETELPSELQPVHLPAKCDDIFKLSGAIRRSQAIEIEYEGIWKEILPLGLRWDPHGFFVLHARHRNEEAVYFVHEIQKIRVFRNQKIVLPHKGKNNKEMIHLDIH